jgi:hypothetical protein
MQTSCLIQVRASAIKNLYIRCLTRHLALKIMRLYEDALDSLVPDASQEIRDCLGLCPHVDSIRLAGRGTRRSSFVSAAAGDHDLTRVIVEEPLRVS